MEERPAEITEPTPRVSAKVTDISAPTIANPPGPELSYSLNFVKSGEQCLDVDQLPRYTSLPLLLTSPFLHSKKRKLTLNNRDWTPLHRAIWRQDLSSVISLCTGTTVNQRDGVGWTPLHLACSNTSSMGWSSRQIYPRNLQSRILYPSSKATFPRRSATEPTALAMIQVLLESGADVNAFANNPKWTPLHNVADSGWINVAHLLLDNGANSFTEGRSCSPYCWAGNDLESGGTRNEMQALLKHYISEEQWTQITANHENMGEGGR